MLALQKTKAEPGVDLVDVASPAAPEGEEVIVRVALAGICGSDLHIDDWDASFAHWASRLPMTLGHEVCGQIIAIGPEVPPDLLGQRVAIVPGGSCGRCELCRSDQPHDCSLRKTIGVSADGAFAPLVRVSTKQCLVLPSRVSDRLGTLVEPLTVGLASVKQAEISSGTRVVIFGPGTIGQAAALMARRLGAAHITIVGLNDEPRLSVLRCMGFASLVDLVSSPADALSKAAGVQGFDAAIEASGSSQALASALRLVKPGGVVSVVALYANPVTLDISYLVRRKLQLRGVARIEAAIWEEVMKAIVEDPQSFEPMITHEVPLSRAIEGFALARSRIASKVLIRPDQAD